MKCFCIMSGLLAMAATVMPAKAVCPVPPGAVPVALPSGLPSALRRALPDDIALPGEPFDTTDVYVKGQPLHFRLEYRQPVDRNGGTRRYSAPRQDLYL